MLTFALIIVIKKRLDTTFVFLLFIFFKPLVFYLTFYCLDKNKKKVYTLITLSWLYGRGDRESLSMRKVRAI